MDKQIALDVISNLPDDISMEDIVEALYLKIKIGKRIDNFDKRSQDNQIIHVGGNSHDVCVLKDILKQVWLLTTYRYRFHSQFIHFLR